MATDDARLPESNPAAPATHPIDSIGRDQMRKVPIPPPVETINPARLVAAFPRELKPTVLKAMTLSVAAKGVLSAIKVGRLRADGLHPIADGVTRHMAALAAGVKLVPVQIHDELVTDADIADFIGHAEEKSSRTDPEMAVIYRTAKEAHGYAHDKQVAEHFKHNPTKVCRCLLLLKQPPAVVAKLDAGLLAAGHFAAVRKCNDPDRQVELLLQAAADEPGDKFKLSVAELAKLAAGRPKRTAAAGKTFTLREAGLVLTYPRCWSYDRLAEIATALLKRVAGQVKTADPKALPLTAVLGGEARS